LYAEQTVKTTLADIRVNAGRKRQLKRLALRRDGQIDFSEIPELREKSGGTRHGIRSGRGRGAVVEVDDTVGEGFGGEKRN